MIPLVRLALVAALAGLPFGVSAEQLGTITAFLDGHEKRWLTITIPQKGRTVATASLDQGQRRIRLDIQGHAEPRFTISNVLSIDAIYLAALQPGAQPVSASVVFMPDGMGGPFWTSSYPGSAPRIDILSAEIWGNVGKLQAVISARLCLRQSISTATDPDSCREMNGLIDTTFHASRR